MGYYFEDEPLIRRYLLGDLERRERTRVALSILSDGARREEWEMIETELVDDYVLGLLSLSERDRFERFFLVTPERRWLVRFSEAFFVYLERCDARWRG